MPNAPAPILSETDHPPFMLNRAADTAFLVVCDHASAAIPARLGTLGLTPEILGTHIASDLGALRRAGLDPVSDNEPYALEPGVDYTVPEHAQRAGLEYLQVEFRQDLIGTEAHAQEWADRLVDAIADASAAGASRATEAWMPPWSCPHQAVHAAVLLAPSAFERADQNL